MSLSAKPGIYLEIYPIVSPRRHFFNDSVDLTKKLYYNDKCALS